MNPPEHELDYPWPDVPALGTWTTLRPGVHWVRMPLPFALDHINLWVLDDEIEGRAGYTIIDSGISSDVTKQAWERLFDGFVQARPVTRVIATHLHPDHAGNVGRLTGRFGAPLYMSQSDYLMAHAWRENTAGFSIEAMTAHLARHGLAVELYEGQASRGNAYRRSVPDFPRVYRRIMESDALEIGGRARCAHPTPRTRRRAGPPARGRAPMPCRRRAPRSSHDR